MAEPEKPFKFDLTSECDCETCKAVNGLIEDIDSRLVGLDPNIVLSIIARLYAKQLVLSALKDTYFETQFRFASIASNGLQAMGDQYEKANPGSLTKQEEPDQSATSLLDQESPSGYKN